MKEEFLIGGASEGGAADREIRLPDPIASAKRQWETVEEAQWLQVGIGPAEDRRPQVAQQFPHPFGAAGKAALLGKVGEEASIGSTHLPQPSPFSGAVTEFADQQHGERLGIRELVRAGAAPLSRSVSAPIAHLRPVVDQAVDHQEKILAGEAVG